MINTIEQLNEVILHAYELHSVEFCYNYIDNIIIFFNTNNDVTSSFYIKPLLDQGFKIEAIKKHAECALEQLNAIHYEDEEEIPYYSISLKEG